MTTASTEPSAARRYLLLAAKLAVSVVLLKLLFRNIDLGQLWTTTRRASILWLVAALGVYFINVVASVWRWHVLLEAQQVHIKQKKLLGSFLVALFFNNFLPSNIGGDVIRIRDTAKVARSKTLATTVVLTDRVLGLIGLVLVAALGSSMVAGVAGHAPAPLWPSWLWAGCVAATQSGESVSFVFDHCTGKYGLVTVTGTVDVSYALNSD
ncbi:MAG: lysylphosphatidylglycerol synthase transmembrane domain-containing protein, partial [Vicinamibacterales bacterium]